MREAIRAYNDAVLDTDRNQALKVVHSALGYIMNPISENQGVSLSRNGHDNLRNIFRVGKEAFLFGCKKNFRAGRSPDLCLRPCVHDIAGGFFEITSIKWRERTALSPFHCRLHLISGVRRSNNDKRRNR
ncbi:MAG: hypothetical protein A2413_07630 [Treponema sp. RIFOXYC1_FULL_61_9]|nr:MAG: hypothetical protein A2413_07630 [Treponema sp. RIFOXYC1_FULL_61_9]